MADLLELFLQDDLLVRSSRQIQRRIKVAGFRELKTLEELDWSFNTTIKKKPAESTDGLPRPEEPMTIKTHATGRFRSVNRSLDWSAR